MTSASSSKRKKPISSKKIDTSYSKVEAKRLLPKPKKRQTGTGAGPKGAKLMPYDITQPKNKKPKLMPYDLTKKDDKGVKLLGKKNAKIIIKQTRKGSR